METSVMELYIWQVWLWLSIEHVYTDKEYHRGEGISVSFLKCFCYKIMVYSRKEIKDRGQTIFLLFQDLGKAQILECLHEWQISFTVFLTGHWKTKSSCFGDRISQLCWNLTFLGKEIIEARTLLASQHWVVLLSVMLAHFVVSYTRWRFLLMQERRQDCWVITDQSPFWKMSGRIACGEKWNYKPTNAAPDLWPGEQVPGLVDTEWAASK